MARRYHDVQPVLLTEVRPGDRIVQVRTVTRTVATSDRVTVDLDDGTTITGDLAQDPGVEIITRKDDQ